jgi:hypothetical protein
MRAAQDETILAFLDRYLRGAQPRKQQPAYAGIEPLARASQLER